LHKGQHFFFLHQPALHPALEHRGLAGRAQAFAVHHAHAAPAVLVRLSDEIGQGLPGVFAPKAMQVELALQSPAAASELAHDIGPEPGAPKAQGLVGFEQGFDVELIRQGLAHHRLFVQPVLHWHGLGRRCRDGPALPVLAGQRPHRPHAAGKQLLLRLRESLGLQPRRFLLGLHLGLTLDLLLEPLELTEVLDGRRFHRRHCKSGAQPVLRVGHGG
jgi:hypothetical protein